MTTKFSGSKYKHFTLKSFWFACGLNNVQNAADTTKQCTILVAGFRGEQEIAAATFTFSPTVAQRLSAPMIKAVLPSSFANVDTVTMIQSNPTTQAFNVDNIDYVLYK